MAWPLELIRVLRHLINDLDETNYTYSDTRLKETILVAGQLMQQDLTFLNTYTINVGGLTLTPDPTIGTRDDAFINLVVLRAGCIIDNGSLRAKLGNAGFVVKVGQDMVDTRGVLEAYQRIADNGLCKLYQDAKWEYEAGNAAPGRAILGPFSGPNFCSDFGAYEDHRSNDGNYF